MIAWLNDNPYLNLAGLALGLLGVMLSVYFYLRSKREKRPYWNATHFPLVVKSLKQIAEVEILYGGQPISDLTLSRFALWNAGRDLIHGSDVAAQDPIRIEVIGGRKLLGAKIAHASHTANHFTLNSKPAANRVDIAFDYFSLDEGVIIDVYHTGKSGDDLALCGTIKGVGGFSESNNYDTRYTERWTRPLRPLATLFNRLNRLPGPKIILALPLMFLLFVILFAAFVPLGTIDGVANLLKRRRPKQFELGTLPATRR